MIRDLLDEILGEAWVSLLDLASAERVATSFTSRGHKKRESDIIWKFRRRDNDEPVYVYILLEFQSRPDRYMSVRLMTYMGLFFEYLIAEGLLPDSGKLPLVIPVVIYNGIGPWKPALELSELIERLDPSAEPYVPRLRYRLVHEAKVPLALLEASESPVADLFRMERSTAWDEMIGGVARLRQHVGDDESLRRAFEAWMENVIFPRLGLSSSEIPGRLSLEGAETMLAERIDEWNRKLAEESLQKGRQEGRKEGEAHALLRLLEKKFGALPKGAEKRIAGAELELLLRWFDRAVTAERLEDVFAE
jgi:predicted transposase YdaD